MKRFFMLPFLQIPKESKKNTTFNYSIEIFERFNSYENLPADKFHFLLLFFAEFVKNFAKIVNYGHVLCLNKNG